MSCKCSFFELWAKCGLCEFLKIHPAPFGVDFSLQRNTPGVWGLKITNCQTPGCWALSHSPGPLMGQPGFQHSVSPSSYCTSFLLCYAYFYSTSHLPPKVYSTSDLIPLNDIILTAGLNHCAFLRRLSFFVYVYGLLGSFSEARSCSVVLISTHCCLPTFGSGWQWAGRKQAFYDMNRVGTRMGLLICKLAFKGLFPPQPN